MKKAERPAIVLVAFGTSNAKARKVFDHIDAAAKKRYPEYEIHWAFTSQFIRKKLKRQGIDIKNLNEVVADLKKVGHASAVFQSLHVAPGQEFNEIDDVDTSGLRIAVGNALLADDKDIKAVIAAIDGHIKKGMPNVLICHGNKKHPEYNRQLVALAEKIESQYANVVVCSINGQPGTDKLEKAKREAAKSGSVHFIPMMVVAGVHVMEDVLSDEDDSWKNVVGAKKTTCDKPLGYNDKILAIYFGHLDRSLAEVKKQPKAGDRR